MQTTLTALPGQPASVPWPAELWPVGSREQTKDARFTKLADELFDLPPEQGFTFGLVIVQGGELIYDRYGFGHNWTYLQYSWSMAKSITQALIGILARQGKLSIEDRAMVPEWQASDDPRREITIDHLLQMRSGLEFTEDYVDGNSDVIEMLSGKGRLDCGAFAAAKPLQHPPGSQHYYSSGTTNILCRIIRDLVQDDYRDSVHFMRDELFEPLGMKSPVPKLDNADSFVGSSFCLATPQDFARFGLLFMRDGVWNGRRMLPEGWADYARTPTMMSEDSAYGAHWWVKPEDLDVPAGTFWASGYDGQRLILVPEKDLIVVRSGRTPATTMEPVMQRLVEIINLL